MKTNKLTIPEKARVEVFALEDGKKNLLANVVFENGTVVIEGDSSFAQGLKEGVDDPFLQERVTPKDGFAFLSAITAVYDSAYLFTSGIITD